MKKQCMFAALVLLASTGASAQKSGDWVLARWKGDQYWFPGVVESRAGDHVTIAYDDGTRETLPTHLLRAYDWKVGSRVSCQWQGGTEWYAGKITAMSHDGVTIHVAYDDGDREQTRTGSCRSQ